MIGATIWQGFNVLSLLKSDQTRQLSTTLRQAVFPFYHDNNYLHKIEQFQYE